MSDYNSSLPVRTENDGDVVVKVGDATVPSQQLTVNVDGSVNVTDNGGSLTVDQATHDNLNANANIQVGDADVDDTNPVPVSDAGGSLTVDAVDLDIRDLDSAQDSVEVLQATHDNLNANANIQVGNADVANGNPVPVSDAGGSITVDAVDLDIRNLVFATDKVDVTGSQVGVTNFPTTVDTNYGTVGASTIRVASQVGNATGAADFNAGVTGAQTPRVTANITRNGTELAYNIGASDANTQRVASLIHDGTDTLAVNTDGSINVVQLEDTGTEVVNYNTSAALAGGATNNHDLVFASASKLYQVWGSASGKLKITVQIETGSATNVFNTVAVGFNSTANPNIDLKLTKYAVIPAGARVRVIRQNNDNQAQDVYSTIVGILG